MRGDTLPVSVLVCTVGRATLLRNCLDSVAACRPRAAEIVVVDQSRDDAVERLTDELAAAGVRRVPSAETGIGAARNTGLAAAAFDLVLFTDDDCTVAADWIGRAYEHVAAEPEAIVTGRVLPGRGGASVPSTIEVPVPKRYSDATDFAVLFTGNMAAPRSALLAIGGFDPRIRPSATDNDLCYRWLRAGRPMTYRPDLVVWHHDWRTSDDVARRYVEYGIGQGMFYAKHLRARDWTIARHLARDVGAGCRALAARLLRRRPPAPDPRTAMLRGLPIGLVRGWRVFAPTGELS